MIHRLFRRQPKLPFYRQLDSADCGIACLRMIAGYHGRSPSRIELGGEAGVGPHGTTLRGLSEAAEKLGFRTLAARIPADRIGTAPTPFVVHWQQQHFVVVHRVNRSTVEVADPSFGFLKYTRTEFFEHWTGASDGSEDGVVLLLQPTPSFFEGADQHSQSHLSWKVILGYLLQYKALVVQLALGLLVGTALTLVFPLTTQALVDVGIQGEALGFVYLMLIAQLMLAAGRMSIEFFRSWILLHVSTRMNVSLLSDFLAKLLSLPAGFFESAPVGDIMQRIRDHRRIEQFLLSDALNAPFAIVTLVIYGGILLLYDMGIFLVFLVGSIISILWVLIFLKRRRELDYKSFEAQAEDQNKIVHLVRGAQEIKVAGAETQKRWEWEHVQARLFKVNVSSLSVGLGQQLGSSTVHELKNVVITFLAANAVIGGEMTLGMMMAAQFIVGQLNTPITQIVAFIVKYQDAKISLERLNEIHGQPDEEPVTLDDAPRIDLEKRARTSPATISFNKVDFRYAARTADPVLDELSFKAEAGKITALVGASGSGKSTVLKLLMKLYEPHSGSIHVDDLDLKDIESRSWRRLCGAVMQNGHLFPESIAKNIALGEEVPDRERMVAAARMAEIHRFVRTLPLGYGTRVGENGFGVSVGQQQRLLIARAVYKDPPFLLLDEATSSLDAYHERTIIDNLHEFCEGRTTVVIAHRLSTVRRADKIIVLYRGKVAEEGTHEELLERRKVYYRLIKEQLELAGDDVTLEG